ncbi:UpxY family transcription antiterminator [Aquimarina rhabdastrellae]
MNTTKLNQNICPGVILERKRKKNEKNWYIFYTSPRAEKVVYKDLLARDYDAFLPLTKTLKVWKNRQKKIIESPLFPSYIFVNTRLNEIYDISRIPKIATFIRCGQKPSVIPPNDIATIKKMLLLEQEVSVETTFYEGERVKIIKGPLVGHEGILIEQKGKTRFGIHLNEINQAVFVNVCTSILQKVNTSYSLV